MGSHFKTVHAVDLKFGQNVFHCMQNGVTEPFLISVVLVLKMVLKIKSYPFLAKKNHIFAKKIKIEPYYTPIFNKIALLYFQYPLVKKYVF